MGNPAGIKIDNCEKVEIDNCDIKGFDTAIEASNTSNLDIRNIRIQTQTQDEIIDEVIARLEKEKTKSKGFTRDKMIELVMGITSNVISEVVMKTTGIR